MNLKRKLIALGALMLCLSLLGGVASGAKKKRGTTVLLNSGFPSVNKSGNVKANGRLKTANACKPARAVKLLLTDASGAVLATLDSKSTDTNGNFTLRGKLPNTTAGVTQYVQVKAKKATVRNNICKAGLTPVIPVTVPA